MDYSKYLGEGYEKRCDNVSTIISNHTSWLDIIFFLSQELPSFVSNAGVKKIPMVSKIAILIQCIFVNRSAAKEDLKIVVCDLRKLRGKLLVIDKSES